MTGPTQVLFIGLDSAEPELLREWMDDGTLPALRALRDASVWGAATAPPAFGNGSAWPSFFTAVGPGKHGRYYHHQIRPGSYQIFTFDDDVDFKRPPIWATLSRAGRRVAVIDMVRAPLVQDLNGLQLADWITHDPPAHMRSWPPGIADEVKARFGADPTGGVTDVPDRTADDYIALGDVLARRVAMKEAMSLHYLERGGWDLFMTVFADPHDVGHQCWHLHDATCPQHDAALAARTGDVIEKVYRRLDAAVGRLVERAGPEATVVVFTTPGMGQRQTANFVLEDVLRRLERVPDSQGVKWVEQGRALVRRWLPPFVRRRMRRLTRPNEEAIRASDRHSRKYFAVPNNSNAGAVRINLVGREPRGKVRPGAEYKALCKALSEDLMALRNAETGEPIVDEIIQVAERFEGDQLHALPDLMVIWSRSGTIEAVTSPKIGRLEQPWAGRRSGDHTLRGLFMVRAPGAVPRELPDPVSVMDVGATLPALLGVALRDADGMPIPEVVAEPTREAGGRRVRSAVDTQLRSGRTY